MLPPWVPVAQVCFASSPAVLSSPGLIRVFPLWALGAMAVSCSMQGLRAKPWKQVGALLSSSHWHPFPEAQQALRMGREPGWCSVKVLNIPLQAGGLCGCQGSLRASPILHPTNHPLASGHRGKQYPFSLLCGCKVADALEGPWPLDIPGLLSGAGDFPLQYLSDCMEHWGQQPNTSACSWDGKVPGWETVTAA